MPRPSYSDLLQRKRSGNHGFALIVALSLMAFILLLVVSMTTLVRVELQSSQISMEESIARSNAIFGLYVAIGELQKTAGPDQRVSGTADLTDNVQSDAQRHWTGIWDVSNQNPFAPHTAPTLLKWLVSGFDTSGNALQPNSVVEDPVTLIANTTVPENAVIAGRVPIQSQSSGTNGHYAFWVGDEGVKAKINTADPHRDGTNTEQFFSQMSAQRFGIEAISISDDGDDLGTVISPLDLATAKILERLQGTDDFSFIDAGLSSLQTHRIHDITTTSFGLLTDTLNGGLKKDLSLAFEMDLNDFNSTGLFAADGETAPFVNGHRINYLFTFDEFQSPLPKIANPLVRGPTWHLLRNYYRLYKQNDPDRFESYKMGNPKGVEALGSGYKIDARSYFPMTELKQPQASELIQAYYDIDLDPNVNSVFDANSGDEPIIRVTDMAISPIVTRVQYFLSLQSVRIEPIPPETEVKYRLDLIFDPVVTLWNPYNVSLSYDKLGVMGEAFQIPIKIFIREPGDPERSINTYLGLLANPGSDRSMITLNLTDNEIMGPGEIKVYADSSLSLSGGRITGDLLPYSQSIMSQAGYRFTKIDQENADPGEELLLESGTEIRLEAFSNSGLNLYTTLYRNLSMGEERTGITLGSIRSTNNDSIEFNWPPSSPPEYVNINDITGDSGPGKHPIGVFDIHLRPEDTNVPVQFLAHYNPRATSFRQYTGPYYDGEDGTSPGNYHCALISFASWNNQELAIAPDGSGYWGESVTSGKTDVPLFELPTAPLHSLAAFQHVNNISNYTQEPAYIVGNSHASPFIPPQAVTRTIEVGSTGRTQIDWSYLSNVALWDSYFFSSIAPRPDLGLDDTEFDSIFQYYLEGNPLPNARMQWMKTEAAGVLADLSSSSDSGIAPEAYSKSAAHLMVDGAFNVNSTSVEAWKALLSSLNGIDIRYLDGNNTQTANNQDSPFSRASLPAGNANDEWAGYRSLSEEEIQALAEEIVAQVKLRGPFTSLSDFVNRRLTNDGTALKGPLQSAIDQTNINNHFSDQVTTSDLDSDMKYPEHAVGPTAAGAPGYLRQSDLLMTLGPVLSARSDTFTIRAYGDYIHPITGEITEALCEAVVQRTPEYVSNANSPTDTTLNPTNAELGRRFVIRSFRWIDG